MQPKVSICIPTYNGAAYLADCLDSALAQTYREFELLLVDDGSTDDTVKIAEDYERRDSRIRLVSKGKNLGLVQNWNRCVKLAQGDWIKFLFQDDLLDSSCLTRMLEAG